VIIKTTTKKWIKTVGDFNSIRQTGT
jgi:hypothetical protein